MFLDDMLFQKATQTSLNTTGDIIKLTEDLYRICVEKERGTILFDDNKMKIHITEFSKRRILASWGLFVKKLSSVNKPLSVWMTKHGFNTFFDTKTSKSSNGN